MKRALILILAVLLAGCTAEPMQTEPVTQSAQTTEAAAEYPAFSETGAYLFCDEEGFLNPEDALSGADLEKGLLVLTADPLPAIPKAATVTGNVLRTVLEGCFPEEKLEAAFDLTENTVTRGDFVRVMDKLLERTNHVCINPAGTIPRDVALEDPMAGAMLRASLTYQATDKGLEIVEAVKRRQWEPGFTILDGRLYYADEAGTLLRNGTLGTLTFGADGAYTSGDGELDAMTAQLIGDWIREAPDATREELLYRAFCYCRDSFTYAGKMRLDYGAEGWEAEAAKKMLQSGAGNCYGYAGIFWALARNLGFDAVGISGNANEPLVPHGWVEIKIEEKTYIFDPQMAMSELEGHRDNWGEDMFAVPISQSENWNYDSPGVDY